MAFAVCCLGLSAFLTQVVLMRELLGVFSGNELVFGVVLGNWMLLTGLGAGLGRTSSRLKNPQAAVVAALVILAAAPIADVFLLRTLRDVVFVRGAEVGPTDVVVVSFMLLAPYCVVLGYTLAMISGLAARRNGVWGLTHFSAHSDVALDFRPTAEKCACPLTVESAVGWVYSLDNAGSVLGGLAFSGLLVHLLSHFGILYVPAGLCIAAAAWLALRQRRWRSVLAVAVVAVAMAALFAAVDLDRLSAERQYAPQRVVHHGHSPYGNLVVTELDGQYSFLENGVALFSTQNVQQVEETVHYAMAQRPRARRVLLVGGGVSGTAREILRYGVEAVDYVELDPQVIELSRRFQPEALDDRRIHPIATDGRLFVKQTQERYDVVILDTPDPSTSQINRFYTEEFFAEVRRILSPEGVISLSLGHDYDGYIDRETARALATLHRTLEQVFGRVMVIPGDRFFLLASDGELTTEIAERLDAAGIRTRRVNRPYVAAMTEPSRMADVRRAIAAAGPVNRDFSPILYFYHLRYWMSQFRISFGLLEAAIGLTLVVYLLRARPVARALFATGFAASALEVVLLLSFQILYGSLYHQVGLIVTMFMLGLGIGSLVMNRNLARRGRRDLVRLLALLAIFALALPLLLTALGRLDGRVSPTVAWVAIPLLTLLLAVLVGQAFPLAAKLDLSKVAGTPTNATRRCPVPATLVAATASRLYLADYLGASLGALVVSTLLTPLIGVPAVCFLAAAIVVLSAAELVVRSK
jgi:spermidine synthase